MLILRIGLNFVSYFFVEAIIIQLIHKLLDYKVINKWLTIFFIMITAVPIVCLENHILGSMPGWLKEFIEDYYLICRLILYCVVFKTFSKKILYIFGLIVTINQIFSNLIRPICDEKIVNIVLYFSEIIILEVIVFYMKKNNKAEIYRQVIASLPKKLYILILIMLLIAAIFVMGSTMEKHEIYEKYLLLPSMIGLVLSTIAIIKIGISEAEKKSEVDLLSKQMEGQIGYYEKINKIYGEFRSFRHDYKNHVLCLRGLIAADKKDEALEYMNTMQDMSSVGKNKYHTGNVIIDALLDDKSDKAEKVRTKLDFEGVVPSSGISNADLCVIIANAIDNAIEACSKDESENEKIIKVDSDFRQGYFFLRVSNPMFEEVKFKGKNKVATSKADKEHHGFGVANIVHTAEKHGGTAEISTDNGKFTIEVQLMLEQTYAEQSA